MFHDVRKLRGDAIRIARADNGAGQKGNFTIVDDFGREVRNVNQNVAFAPLGIEPALALQCDHHRLQPLFHADVDLCHGGSTDFSIRVQPMGNLELLNRV